MVILKGKVKVNYIIPPSLVSDTINSHFSYADLPNEDLRHNRRMSRSRPKRPLIASEAVVKTLMKHFEDDGFKVTKIWNHSRKSEDDKRRREYLDGLTVSWFSSGVEPVDVNTEENVQSE